MSSVLLLSCQTVFAGSVLISFDDPVDLDRGQFIIANGHTTNRNNYIGEGFAFQADSFLPRPISIEVPEGLMVNSISLDHYGITGGRAFTRNGFVFTELEVNEGTETSPPFAKITIPEPRRGQYIRRLELFVDEDAGAMIDNVRVGFADDTLEELLGNPIENIVTNNPDIGAISFDFSQRDFLNYDLYDVAEVGGFHHFNWFSEITALDCAICLRGPGPDPSVDGISALLGGADSYPWYYDEKPLEGREGAYYRTRIFTTWMYFQDSPNLVLPGNSAEFSTYLVGVRDDEEKSGVVFDPQGGYDHLGLKWRFTQTGLSEGEATLFQNLDPELGGEGVFEFLGFLEEEDWDQERIDRLAGHGLTLASSLGPLEGDVNGDGAVDLADFNLLKGSFGVTEGAVRGDGDLNGDGSVDLQDFTILKENFGAGVAQVPEPSAWLLAALAAAVAAVFWHRRGEDRPSILAVK